MDSPEQADRRVQRDQLVSRVHPELPDLSVLRVIQDPRVRLDRLEHQDLRVRKDLQELRELLGHPGLPDLLETLGTLAILGHPDLRVSRVNKVNRAHVDNLVQLELPEDPDHKELPVPLEHQAALAEPDSPAQLVYRDLPDPREQLDRRAGLGPPDLQDIPEKRETVE